MFALPNSKRVRRNELDSPSSSRASSPDSDILARLRATTQFDLIEAVPSANPSTNQPAAEGDDDDVELAFNLFAPATTTTTTTSDNNASSSAAPQTEQKIRLRSPTPLSEQNSGFTVPSRPDQTYYFTGPLSPTKAAEYDAAAVEGTTILQDWSKRPCPGCAYPWKVISIPTTSASKALGVSLTPAADKFLPDNEEEEKEKKRRRLGKNARIKKRVKAEKARLRKEEAEKGKEEKEKAEREKRAKRNREKKFKKRARDKAKKAAGGEVGGEGEDAQGSGSGSGSEGEGDE